MIIKFKGKCPEQNYFKTSVKGNSNVDILTFQLDRLFNQIDLSNFQVSLKVKSNDLSYVDIITNLAVENTDSVIIITYIMSPPVTLHRNLDMQLELKYGEFLWQSQIFNLTLESTIAAEQIIGKNYPSILDLKAEIVNYQTHYEFPNVGNEKNIYIATDENKTYRYDLTMGKYFCIGSDYSEIETIIIGG